MADRSNAPEELLTDEERRKRGKLLTQEIALKYDPDRLSKVIVSQAGRGERLDEGTRNEMERKLGGSFSNVRIFRGPFAEAVTRQHRAEAVTIGGTGMILVKEGPRSDPATSAGKSLLAHELTHVAQAQKGLHFDTGGDNPGSSHEVEARAAEQAVHEGDARGNA